MAGFVFGALRSHEAAHDFRAARVQVTRPSCRDQNQFQSDETSPHGAFLLQVKDAAPKGGCGGLCAISNLQLFQHLMHMEFDRTLRNAER